MRRVIVTTLHEEEAAAAASSCTVQEQGDGVIVGLAAPAAIDALRARGILVEELPDADWLEAAGFTDVDVRLHDEPTALEPGEPLREYLRTVVLGAHLERLPPEAAIGATSRCQACGSAHPARATSAGFRGR